MIIRTGKQLKEAIKNISDDAEIKIVIHTNFNRKEEKLLYLYPGADISKDEKIYFETGEQSLDFEAIIKEVRDCLVLNKLLDKSNITYKALERLEEYFPELKEFEK